MVVLDQQQGIINNLAKQNENLQGQIAQLSRQIKTEGRGNEFPGCWVTKDGKAESIFEITFTEAGIRVHQLPLPHRHEEWAQLHLETVVYDHPLEVAEFKAQFKGIYKWSIEHDCRFHVQRSTADVRTRIDLQNAVDRFFYPGGLLKVVGAPQ